MVQKADISLHRVYIYIYISRVRADGSSFGSCPKGRRFESYTRNQENYIDVTAKAKIIMEEEKA